MSPLRRTSNQVAGPSCLRQPTPGGNSAARRGAAWEFNITDRLGVTGVAPFLTNAGRWQAHTGIAYTANFAALQFTPRVDASYQSRTFFDATHTREIAYVRLHEYFGTPAYDF